MTVDDAIEAVCGNPLDQKSWEEWSSDFSKVGMQIDSDDSGFLGTKILGALEASQALRRCRMVPLEISDSTESESNEIVQACSMTIAEWKKAYDYALHNPPIGELLAAERGPVRLEMELHPGQAPFVFTRAYIRDTVGLEPKWFVQGAEHTNVFGWKVILLPKSRDEVIKRHGVSSRLIFVKMIQIVKTSATNRALLCEVVQW